MPASHRLLLVEDDTRIAELVGAYLGNHGLAVEVCGRGDEAIVRIQTDPPDVVVLDGMLPGADGFEVLRQVRPAYTGPVLMLTARTDAVDQVVGLELGADDYVPKPANPRVLLARIRALLRRAEPVSADRGLSGSNERLEDGGLVIDRRRREVLLDGALVELTTAEFDLLWVLASTPGKPWTRDQLFEKLRGIPYDGLDRSMDMRVSQLRKVLHTGGRVWVKTVRGLGYQFVPQRTP